MKSLYALSKQLGPILSPKSIKKSLYGKTELERKIIDKTLELNISENLISKELFDIDNTNCYATVISTEDLNISITVNESQNDKVSEELKSKSIKDIYNLSTVKIIIPQCYMNNNDKETCEKIYIIISSDYIKYMKDINDTIEYISLLFKDIRLIDLNNRIVLSPMNIYGININDLDDYYKFISLLSIHIFSNINCSEIISNQDIYDESDFAKSLFKDSTDMSIKLSKIEKMFSGI